MKKFIQSVPTVTIVFIILGIISFIWSSGQKKKAEYENSVEIFDVINVSDISKYENKTVCAYGKPVVTQYPKDNTFGVTCESCILVRNVEMYQYVLSGDTVYRQFSSVQQSDVKGKNGEKFINPSFPENMKTASFFGDVTLGESGVSVSPDFINALYNKESGVSDNVRIEVLDKIEIKGLNPCGDGYFTKSDPENPEIGDVRVRYTYIVPDSIENVTVCGLLKNGVITAADTDISYSADCIKNAGVLLGEIKSDAALASDGFIKLGVIEFTVAAIVFIVKTVKKKNKTEGEV